MCCGWRVACCLVGSWCLYFPGDMGWLGWSGSGRGHVVGGLASFERVPLAADRRAGGSGRGDRTGSISELLLLSHVAERCGAAGSTYSNKRGCDRGDDDPGRSSSAAVGASGTADLCGARHGEPAPVRLPSLVTSGPDDGMCAWLNLARAIAGSATASRCHAETFCGCQSDVGHSRRVLLAAFDGSPAVVSTPCWRISRRVTCFCRSCGAGRCRCGYSRARGGGRQSSQLAHGG